MVSFTKISRLIRPVVKSTRPYVDSAVPIFAMLTPSLEKKGQILRQQDVLVQNDLSLADLPLSVHAPKDVLPFTHEDIRLRFHPVAVNQETALDGNLCWLHHRGLDVQDLNVGNHVAEARGRLLRPMDAGQDLLNPPRQGFFALVKPIDVLALAGEFPVRLPELDIPPYRHPVAHIFG